VFPRSPVGLLLPLLIFLPAAFGDWTASGTFQYRDRGYDGSGFTGTNPTRPIREADVQVLDTGTSAVLAWGATTSDGSFSIAVTDLSTRNIAIRVLTSATQTTSLNIRVRDDSTNQNTIAVTGHSESTHLPTANVNIGTFVVENSSGGDEFNIFDCLVNGADYAAAYDGTRPSVMVTAYWESGSTDGTFFLTDNTLHLVGKASDSDAYDDAVILHEYGHYLAQNYSQDDSPGGSHTINDNQQDPRLAWSEGWASYLGCAIQRHRGYPVGAAHHYVDTDGSSASGGLLLQYNLENLSSNVVTSLSSSALYSTNESAVSAVLWDIIDSVEADEGLALADGEPWEIFNDHIGGLAAATVITLEDFWNGWFSTTYDNGNLAALEGIFGNRSIEFKKDAYEPNNGSGTAAAKPTDGTATHHTFYKEIGSSPPDPAVNATSDEDWFSFAATGGQGYSLRTEGLVNDADTVLTFYDTDGATQLQQHDNRSGSDKSSLISWTATTDGTYYVKCHRASSGNSTYGSYDFKISLASASPDAPGGEGGGGGGGSCFVTATRP
jgi:hypothetical protein